MSTTVRIPRESTEWVGPITITVDDEPVTSGVQFAVIPERDRPADDDWTDPYLEPGGTALGVWQAPVADYQVLRVWAKITDSPEIPVLDDVGRITRT